MIFFVIFLLFAFPILFSLIKCIAKARVLVDLYSVADELRSIQLSRVIKLTFSRLRLSKIDNSLCFIGRIDLMGYYEMAVTLWGEIVARCC